MFFVKKITVKDFFFKLSTIENITNANIKTSIDRYMNYLNSIKDVDTFYIIFKNRPNPYVNIPKYVYVFIAGVIEHIYVLLNISIPPFY